VHVERGVERVASSLLLIRLWEGPDFSRAENWERLNGFSRWGELFWTVVS